MISKEGWLLGLSQPDEMEVHLGVFATPFEAKVWGDRFIIQHGFPLSGWSVDGWSDQIENHHGRFFFRELGQTDDEPPYDSIFITPVQLFV